MYKTIELIEKLESENALSEKILHDTFLTTAEVCAILRITPETLRKTVTANSNFPQKIIIGAKTIRYSLNDLKAYLHL